MTGFFASIALCLLGCSSEEPGEQTSRSSEALEDGIVAGTQAPDLRAVGHLVSQFGTCTATLVGPRIALTAAHCVQSLPGCRPPGLAPRVSAGEPASIIFHGPSGVPGESGDQTIAITGIAQHPDAYGDRITNCPFVFPQPTTCPVPSSAAAPGCDLDPPNPLLVDPEEYVRPNCQYLSACSSPGGIAGLSDCQVQAMRLIISTSWGHKKEHDLALVTLERAPTGIAPMPMLTRGWSAPELGVFEAPRSVFDPWVAGTPVVTQAGYGQGTKPDITRDVGTTVLVRQTFTMSQPLDCNGNFPPAVDTDSWYSEPRLANQSRVVSGDSGGPLFFGRATVGGNQPAASTLPSGSGLTERRYVVGVAVGSPGLDPENPRPEDPAERFGLHASLLHPANASWLVQSLRDLDGDAQPNNSDNCPGVANRIQENCNRDAETDRQAAVLGDACDPVPCPKVETPATSQSVGTRSPLLAPIAACQATRVKTTRNRIELDTIGSQNMFSGVTAADNDIQTFFRFCQTNRNRRGPNNVAAGVSCALADGQRTWDQMLVLLPSGNPEQPWIGIEGTLGILGQYLVDYPSKPDPLTWNYAGARDAWINSGLIDPPPSVTTGVTGGLQGFLGIRAGGLIDTLGTSVRPSNGIHPTPDSSFQGTRLARHYQSLTPETTTSRATDACKSILDPGIICFGDRRPFCIPPTLPDCLACQPGIRPTGDDWWGDRSRTVIGRPGARGGWGVITIDGGLTVPPDIYSQRATGQLGRVDVRFAARAEQFSLVPDGAQASLAPIQGMFLNDDGTRIEAMLRAGPSGFDLEGEGPPPAATAGANTFSISTPTGAKLNELALATVDGLLKINDGVQVLTQSGSYAKATSVGGAYVGADARVGSLYADGDVDLRNRARVEGSLTSAGIVSRQPDSYIKSTLREQTSPEPIEEPWLVRFPTSHQGDRMLEPDQVLVLAPGAYGAVHVKSRARLKLTAGAPYYFESLFVEPQGILDLDNRTGPLFTYIREGFTFRGAVQERNTALANLLFAMLGSSTVTIEAAFRGTIVAPNAALVLGPGGSIQHVGSFFARSIEVHQHQTVRLRPFTRPDCTKSGGCLGGWESGAMTGTPATRSLGLAARPGYQAVYSAALDSLFVVGGRRPSTGLPNGEIALHRVSLGTTRLLSIPGYAPSKVIAVTATYTDAELWVLDEVGSGTSRIVRLARIDPIGLRAHIVWQGTPAGNYDARLLGIDGVGRVVLYSSSNSLGSYAAVQIDATPFVHGTETFALLWSAPGKLGAVPLASAKAVTYLLAGTGGILQRFVQPPSEPSNVTSLATWL